MGKDSTTDERRKFILDFVKKSRLMTSGKELYDALEAEYPEISPGGHRGMVGRVFDGVRPWSRGKKCPSKGCTTEAADMAQAIGLFGHRYEGKVLQSYCKSCRNRARREARARLKAHKQKQAQAQAQAAAE